MRTQTQQQVRVPKGVSLKNAVLIGEALKQLREKKEVTRGELVNKLEKRMDFKVRDPYRWLHRIETGERWATESNFSEGHRNWKLMVIVCEELGFSIKKLVSTAEELALPVISKKRRAG